MIYLVTCTLQFLNNKEFNHLTIPSKCLLLYKTWIWWENLELFRAVYNVECLLMRFCYLEELLSQGLDKIWSELVEREGKTVRMMMQDERMPEEGEGVRVHQDKGIPDH